jgi:hypothetical protein
MHTVGAQPFVLNRVPHGWVYLIQGVLPDTINLFGIVWLYQNNYCPAPITKLAKY